LPFEQVSRKSKIRFKISDNRLNRRSSFTQFALFVASHDKNIHDSKTLTVAISHANSNRNKPIKQAVCDRGYVGAKVVLGANINKKIVAITSHFLKFQAQAAIKTLISSPTCPLSGTG
jgi:hypothetical protein